MQALQKNNSHLRLYKLKKLSWSLTRNVIIAGICFIILYPIITKLCLSFMAEEDLYDITVKYVPKHFTLDNIKDVWKLMKYKTAFLNSLTLALLASTLQIISCTLIGYGFARFKFPGSNILFGCVILSLIIPPQTIMTPLFLHFRFFDVLGIVKLLNGGQTIKLIDTFWPYILTSSTGLGLKNGLYIFMMRQFFRNMPAELEEAAYVDGLGSFKTFLYIMLPSAIPTIVTVFLFSFVWTWNDAYYPSMFMQNYTILPKTLAGLTTAANAYFGKTGTTGEVFLTPSFASMISNTGSLMMVFPLIIIYIFAQRYFVESIERSGIVG